jgi:hypothetical protein
MSTVISLSGSKNTTKVEGNNYEEDVADLKEMDIKYERMHTYENGFNLSYGASAYTTSIAGGGNFSDEGVGILLGAGKQHGKQGTFGYGVKLDLQPQMLSIADMSVSKMEISVNATYRLGGGKSIYISYVKKQFTADGVDDFDARNDFVVGYSRSL